MSPHRGGPRTGQHNFAPSAPAVPSVPSYPPEGPAPTGPGYNHGPGYNPHAFQQTLPPIQGSPPETLHAKFRPGQRIKYLSVQLGWQNGIIVKGYPNNTYDIQDLQNGFIQGWRVDNIADDPNFSENYDRQPTASNPLPRVWSNHALVKAIYPGDGEYYEAKIETVGSLGPGLPDSQRTYTVRFDGNPHEVFQVTHSQVIPR